MSNVLIVYFSQGGSTAQIAESITKGLRASGNKITLCNIRNDQPPSLEGYDILGIGTPVYYFRPPFIITDYVNGLKHLKGMPAFVFVIHGTYKGETGNDIRHALSIKGAKETGYFSCLGADFYLPYLKEGYLFSADHPSTSELSQAQKFGIQVDNIMAGQKYITPKYDPKPAIMYNLERFFANHWLVKTLYSRLFHVNKIKCSACDLCIKQCPTGNITPDKDGHPVWNRHCLFCLNCEMICPHEAITTPVSWPIFHPVIKYNVTHASKDATIHHVRVKHRNGITTRQ